MKKVLAAAVALVVALTGVFYATGGFDRGKLDLPIGDTKPDAEGTRTVTVFVDGWSAAVAGGPTLEVTVAGDTEQVVFRPATPAELRAAADVAPDAVTALAARLVNGDVTLRCASEGCLSDAGPVSFGELAEPARHPHLGPTYTTWGIETGVWVATVDLPADTFTFTIAAPGTNQPGFTFSLGDFALSDNDTAEGDAHIAAEPAASNGWSHGVYAVGVAFGQVFPIDAAWLSDAHPSKFLRDETTATLRLPEYATPLFAGGPAAVVDYARSLTPSQLTLMSSPSLGCGYGVACTPYTVYQVTSSTSALTALCRDNTRYPAQLVDARWSATLPGPTQQGGVWNGKTELDRAVATTALWKGLPPDASGKLDLRVVNLFVWDDGGLRDVGSIVVQVGKDPAAMVTRPAADLLADAYANSPWKPCA